MELVIRDPDEGVALRCDSCGREGVPVPLYVSVGELLEEQRAHLHRSHKMTEQDTKEWHV